jgi:ribonucleoside-diphosphate reductase alpha chain
MSGFERKGKPNVPLAEVKQRHSAHEGTFTQAEAKAAGYTGNICDVCGSTRMRVAGHCLVCEECGTSTGCS